MLQTLRSLTLAAACLLVACKKEKRMESPEEQEVVTVTPAPVPTIPPSRPLLLTEISGDFNSGYPMKFFYNGNRLTGFKPPFLRAPEFFVYYLADQRPGYVAVSYYDVYITKLTAAIFRYNAAGDVCKVYYKKVTTGKTLEDTSYFNSITDGQLQSEYDSLSYTAGHHIEAIYTIRDNAVWNYVRFRYNTPQDSIPFKLDKFEKVADRHYSLYDQLQLTTNQVRSPYHAMWFLAYINKLTSDVGGGGLLLPYLMDGPSTYLTYYLPFIKNCIVGYQVSNNWGSYNYKNSVFQYTFNTDSTLLTVTKQGDPFSKVQLHLKPGV
ncbi:hypothetical protein [Chitinophaga nivalis]|uniref:DUF4595 domain-containing protein n=1 Tax=Chitinophaga nivalis TaxID=2991709 RepID=A0ABT3IKH5_9BACT|nr:hypothetical protein [Chitinophaga nivalis]MCW3465840.1 hypothetical protein [Chitinophaga nivalis]MCW3484469.1 hypothetical protein [Chitinophaga nivalis]